MKNISDYTLGEIRDICRTRQDCEFCDFYSSEGGWSRVCKIEEAIGELYDNGYQSKFRRPEMWEV